MQDEFKSNTDDSKNCTPIEKAEAEITMQKRKCAGGCKSVFKVHPKSKQTRARGNCENVCGVKTKPNEKPIVLQNLKEDVSFHVFPEVKKTKHVWSPEFHRNTTNTTKEKSSDPAITLKSNTKSKKNLKN